LYLINELYICIEKEKILIGFLPLKKMKSNACEKNRKKAEKRPEVCVSGR